MKHCIIHRRTVSIEMKIGSESYKKKAKRAHRVIENLIDKEDVVLIDKGDPKTAGSYFNKGDEVVLSGAYLGMCLAIAYNSLVRKGCKVNYHKEGCI